jgi:RNA polymerase sigma-70 factor, ECF subfamily
MNAVTKANGVVERIVQAAHGDRAAIGDLLAEHHDAIARHLLPRIPESRRGEISVEDVIQDSYVQVVSCIQQLEIRTPEGFKAWLIRIVDNELQSRLRSIHRSKRGGGRSVAQLEADPAGIVQSGRASADETPSCHEQRREAVSAVQSKVDDLSTEQRDAVRLHYLGGKSVAATAQEMKQSSGAIRGLLQRARLALRKSLASVSRWNK